MNSSLKDFYLKRQETCRQFRITCILFLFYFYEGDKEMKQTFENEVKLKFNYLFINKNILITVFTRVIVAPPY